MEFYELNRLYDETLKYTRPSDRVDSYLYFLIPTIISFGLGISLISIISLSMNRNSQQSRGGFAAVAAARQPTGTPSDLYINSKTYLLAQSMANFAYQAVTSIILITNYYEKRLIDTSYFQNNKATYFGIKCALNFLYNIFFYAVVWLFLIAAFDYCVMAIKKLHLHETYSRKYRHMFERLLVANQVQHLRRNHSMIRTASHRHKTSLHPKSATARHLEFDKYASRTRCSSTSSCSYQQANEYVDDCHVEHANVVDETLTTTTTTGAAAAVGTTVGVAAVAVGAHSTINTDRIFCKPKAIYYSIFMVTFFSFMLAFPQMFAYEITESIISVSPSPMPTSAKSLEHLTVYEHVYFVQGDDYTAAKKNDSLERLKEEYLFRLLNRTSMSYSDTVGRAMAFSIRIDRLARDTHVRDLLARMHKTHKRFFTQIGFFNLVSKQYDTCNILKNSLDASPIILRPTPPRLLRRAVMHIGSQGSRRGDDKQDPNDAGEKIEYFNLTVTCIKKSELNTYLTYNTLYFWLEHTMVISVPVCVNLVVVSSLVYTFLKFTKLQTYQYRYVIRRKKLSKLLKRGLSKNYQTLYINEHQLSRKESKRYRSHKPGSEINILNDEFINELHQLEIYENKMIKKQHDDKNLTLMFILDLFLYFLISFPYTLARLVLVLFVKDQVKISLDFFVLFKTSMLAFHVHLIAKFFLMLALHRNFRKCLAWSFSIQNLTCQNGDSCDCCCCCCCCWNSSRRDKHRMHRQRRHTRGQSLWLGTSSPTDSNMDNIAAPIGGLGGVDFCKNSSFSIEDDESLCHSTEFNSNYHQFYCPAEPNETDLIPSLTISQSKTKITPN